MENIKILLVDDDEELRTSIEFFLKNKGYNVASAINGVKAFDYFLENDFNIVLSDIRMPLMDGTTLLNAVKSRKPEIFFILMTGFAEILSTIDAYQMGADGFLAKPFKLNELENIIQRYIRKKSGEAEPVPDRAAETEKGIQEETDNDEDLYKPIDIDKFIHGSTINYPIFVKLGNEKFVKIAHKGEDISEENITKYKAHNIKSLYLLNQDFKEYVKMAKDIVNAISENVIKIPHARKIKFLSAASEVIMRDVFSDSIHKGNFESAHSTIKKAMEIALDNNDLFEICDSVLSHSEQLHAHSLFVSMFSIMLARHLNWISEKNMDLISMGALFHDLGKKALPQKLIDKRLIDLNYEEHKQIELHPAIGAEMLMDVKDIPEVVIQITLQHHENIKGSGYPSRLTSMNIHPLAKVVSIANEFAIAVESLEKENNSTRRYYLALKKLKTLKRGLLEKEYFDRFLKLFKFEGEEAE
ncbi:MAG: response regulator [Oligoflexia bacterium]|nr:response regulator [Oligoflexia bacterium]